MRKAMTAVYPYKQCVLANKDYGPKTPKTEDERSLSTVSTLAVRVVVGRSGFC